MPAMHDEVLETMIEQLEQKCALMQRLNTFSMTHEELLSLLCSPRDAALLLEASKVAEGYGQSEWTTVDIPANVDGVAGVSASFRIHTHAYKTPPLRPKFPVWQLPANSAQVALGERVIGWMENRYAVGRRFGMAKHVLKELNKLCTHGSQLTYLMPTISHLCKPGKTTRMDVWLQRFGAFKPVKNAPALSLPLRKATGDAAALLTTVALLGDDVPAPEEGEVEIMAVDMPKIKFEEDWVSRF